MKIALVGCGAAAERYYVPAIKKHPEIINQLFLVDRNRTQAENLAQMIGGGNILMDHKEALHTVEGAIIALPNFLHHPVVMDFINAGIHVLCEKPLADSYQQAKEMVDAAATNDVHLCVNNTRRMFPAFQAIKQTLTKKELGRIHAIRYVEGDRYGWASATGFSVNPQVSSKGLVSDLGSHMIDLICWWIGGKPMLKEYLDDSFDGPESVAKISAEYDGCQIDIFLNRLIDLESCFEIECESGRIQGKPMDWKRYLVSKNSSMNEEINLSCKEKNYPSFIHPIFENFMQIVANAAKPLISGDDVLHSIKFIDNCYANRKRFPLPWYDSIQVSDRRRDGNVLITGATGFIGGSIAERLFLSKERRVSAAVHNWSSAARIGRFPIDIVHMDLMQMESIDRALDGITEIIHCAKGPYEVTVQGTENLLQAAYEKGINRFVHLSTTEVYGNAEGEMTEDTPFNYTGNEYNRMKIDAEKVCWKYSEKGLPIIIIRPSVVYGIFSNNWTVHFAQMFIDGKWGIYEKFGEGKCNLIYIDDLVAAILLAMKSKKAVGQAFNVVSPEVITWNEYFREFNDMMGLPPLGTINPSKASLKTMAMWPVRVAGKIAKNHFMEPVKKIAGTFDLANELLRKTEKSLKTNPSKDELKLFSKDAVFSSDKIEMILGFYSKIPIDKGLQTVINWLRHQGILNK